MAALWLRALQAPLLVADAALVLALALDFLRTPAPGSLGVVRHAPSRVGLSQPFTRSLVVDPGAARGLRLELREQFPGTFAVAARTVDGELVPPVEGDPTGGPDLATLPDEPIAVERRYVGSRRGQERLGDLRLRLRSPWGLLWRQVRLPGDQPVAVEPALLDLRRTLRLAASERWRDLGVRKLRHKGGETDFESLREYVTGDDPRLVDWKATARRGRPMVREFQVERGQELILMIDCGRRMQATTAEGQGSGWSKLDHALDAALQLAAVALQEGDRVGVLAFDSALRSWVPPSRGPRTFARLVEAVFELEPSWRESDLDRALREIAVRYRRRATVVVLSDVADPLSIAEQRAALARGGRAQRLVFAALDDPGVRAAADPERAEEPGPLSTPLRAAALGEVEQRARSLRQLTSAGVRVLSPLPAEAAGPLLTAWLDERRSTHG